MMNTKIQIAIVSTLTHIVELVNNDDLSETTQDVTARLINTLPEEVRRNFLESATVCQDIKGAVKC